MDDALWVQLSALQHFRFCPRQCALIHIEAIWDENRLTAEGRVLHERVHSSGREKRDSLIIVRGLRLYSQRHRLSGIADVVEFHQTNDDDSGVSLTGEEGHWIPFPVEYKRGRPKKSGLDVEQLAAQALCLSEMLSVPVAAGALYYGASKRRMNVQFTEAIFREVIDLANSVRRLLESGDTPAPNTGNHCASCSLLNACLPFVLERSVVRYYRQIDMDNGSENMT
ncbi:MAG: CRISPR-associated protein Cas4 [Planctomycetota bacterium]|nr:CRISPR-associated protein Cas4 [Planctomycetota bacterium]